MNKKNYQKNSNSWSLVGQCSQWAIDNNLTVNELSVYLTIVRHSFGFKKRWCYLDYGSFVIKNSSSVKKTIESLVEKGILSYKWTFKENGHRSKNEYKILKPKDYIDNFIFSKEEKVKPKTEEELYNEDPWDSNG